MKTVWLGLGFIFTLLAIYTSNGVFTAWGSLASHTASWNELAQRVQVPPDYSGCINAYNERIRKAQSSSSIALLIEETRDPYFNQPELALADCKRSINSWKQVEVQELEDSAPATFFMNWVLWPSVGLALASGMTLFAFNRYRKSLDS